MMKKSCNKVYTRALASIPVILFFCAGHLPGARYHLLFNCGKQRLDADRSRAMSEIADMGFGGYGATATLGEKNA